MVVVSVTVYGLFFFGVAAGELTRLAGLHGRPQCTSRKEVSEETRGQHFSMGGTRGASASSGET